MDRPLLGVPVLRPSEPLERLVKSVDEQVRLLVIDNSGGQIDWDQCDWFPEDAWLVQPYVNLGCAGSWNEISRSALLTDPYVLVANADTELAPGALRYVINECERGGPRWVGVDGDWRLFGLTAEAVELVGWFDSRFYPIYNEDCDYEWRCRVAGVPFYHHQHTGSLHGSGLSWKGDADRERENSRTHRANDALYVQKWGGGKRGGEAFATPFDRGEVDLCGPRLSHLRSQQWA